LLDIIVFMKTWYASIV